MEENTLRVKIQDHLELIKFSTRSLQEAQQRTTAFLIMVAILADERRDTEELKAQLSTLNSATYARAMSSSAAKQVTAAKAEAENNGDYTEAREALESCEAKIAWLKTYIDIFSQAHVTYRQFSKE